MAEEAIRVKQFKDGSNNYWCEFRHYWLTPEKELILCAGADESEIHRQKMIKYLKTKKLL